MNNLQRIRKECGMSQGQLAEAAGISVRTLQSYEQGHRDINGMAGLTLYKLANTLGVDMKDLLELEA